MRHGGDLGDAERLYGHRTDWLDLSTGINPCPWPIDGLDLKDMALDRLPSRASLDTLIGAARSAYTVNSQLAIIATPGTEVLIRALPDLCGDLCQIAETSYASYAKAWKSVGRPLSRLRQNVSVNADPSASLIVVNPNNPDGRTYGPELLHAIARSRRDHALLVVDEAFADAEDQVSIVPHLQADDRAIVLKSFGKFFGLPGVRLGFAIGYRPAIEMLEKKLGDWPVSAPAIAIGSAALADRIWQKDTRMRLADMGDRMDRILKNAGLDVIGTSRLFRLIGAADAPTLHTTLARKGIWTRRFDTRPSELRIGLPPDLRSLSRLEQALGSTDYRHANAANRDRVTGDEIAD